MEPIQKTVNERGGHPPSPRRGGAWLARGGSPWGQASLFVQSPEGAKGAAFQALSPFQGYSMQGYHWFQGLPPLANHAPPLRGGQSFIGWVSFMPLSRFRA